jgi:hypothetical protein
MQSISKAGQFPLVFLWPLKKMQARLSLFAVTYVIGFANSLQIFNVK